MYFGSTCFPKVKRTFNCFKIVRVSTGFGEFKRYAELHVWVKNYLSQHCCLQRSFWECPGSCVHRLHCRLSWRHEDFSLCRALKEPVKSRIFNLAEQQSKEVRREVNGLVAWRSPSQDKADLGSLCRSWANRWMCSTSWSSCGAFWTPRWLNLFQKQSSQSAGSEGSSRWARWDLHVSQVHSVVTNAEHQYQGRAWCPIAAKREWARPGHSPDDVSPTLSWTSSTWQSCSHWAPWALQSLVYICVQDLAWVTRSFQSVRVWCNHQGRQWFWRLHQKVHCVAHHQACYGNENVKALWPHAWSSAIGRSHTWH